MSMLPALPDALRASASPTRPVMRRDYFTYAHASRGAGRLEESEHFTIIRLSAYGERRCRRRLRLRTRSTDGR